MLRRIAFALDIDGCLIRGGVPLPGAIDALKSLQRFRVPHVFLTNGGGQSEHARALKLSKILGMNLHGNQFILSHSPLHHISKAERWHSGSGFTLLAGHGQLNDIGDSLGVPYLTANEIHHLIPDIYPFIPADPVAESRLPLMKKLGSQLDQLKIDRVVMVHDSVLLVRDVQICMDVLRSKQGFLMQQLPGRVLSASVPLYNTNEDVVFAGSFLAPRLAQGSFEECLQAMWVRVNEHPSRLDVRRLGKPHPVTYRYAERLLHTQSVGEESLSSTASSNSPLNMFFGVGDNPRADVRGANRAGEQWRSVLVRTGCFSGDNDPVDRAALVYDTVGDAVEHILSQAHKDALL